MTWVVGASSIFGYGVMISDVKVTFSNKMERDLIRKAFAVGPYLLAGFAGSVKIGYELLGDLAGNLRLASGDERAWRPEYVAKIFQVRAAAIFAAADDREKKLRSNILLVGAEPRFPENPFDHRIHVIRMVSPNFAPGYARPRYAIRHIGSGASKYKQRLRPIFGSAVHTTQQAEVGMPYGWAAFLGEVVTRSITDDPINGVSQHVHIMTYKLREFANGTNDRTVYHPDGTEEHFAMPAVAQNYSEFETLCAECGLDAAEAVC